MENNEKIEDIFFVIAGVLGMFGCLFKAVCIFL
jgi:hypothetical protein